MNVSLTEELEQFVCEKVESGRYRSKSEVVRSALRLLQDRETLRDVKLEELREAVQKGLDSGPAEEWDKEEFFERARERWKEARREGEEEGQKADTVDVK